MLGNIYLRTLLYDLLVPSKVNRSQMAAFSLVYRCFIYLIIIIIVIIIKIIMIIIIIIIIVVVVVKLVLLISSFQTPLLIPRLLRPPPYLAYIKKGKQTKTGTRGSTH